MMSEKEETFLNMIGLQKSVQGMCLVEVQDT